MKPLLTLLAIGLSLEFAGGKQIPTFAPADLVLGQADFASANTPATLGASSLDLPAGVAVDASSGRVFVADSGNHRVLRYANAAALQNGAAADRVFGQADFSGHAAPAPPTASSLKSPTGLWIDGGGHLWVADTGNNRVLMYANASATPSANGPAAALVLGQPDAITAAAPSPPTAASLNTPEGLCVDSGGRLWVADKGNNRVLRFDGAASNNTGQANAAADGEFGQDQGAPFTSATAGSTNLQFTGPAGVAVDANGTLWVSDRGNNRIMGFPVAATISNGANGARILGQPDYNGGSTTAGLSASAVSGPTALFADAANGLWVIDQGNNRALRFASLSTIDNGKPASLVVGQPNFDSNATGLDERMLDTQGPAAFAGLFVQADGTLWISDLNHQRVLRFATADSGPPSIAITGKRKVVTPKKRVVVRGTAADDTGVTQVTLLVGSKAIPAAGTTAWSKAIRLKKPRTVVRAYASDAAGHTSPQAKVVLLQKAAP